MRPLPVNTQPLPVNTQPLPVNTQPLPVNTGNTRGDKQISHQTHCLNDLSSINVSAVCRPYIVLHRPMLMKSPVSLKIHVTFFPNKTLCQALFPKLFLMFIQRIVRPDRIKLANINHNCIISMWSPYQSLRLPPVNDWMPQSNSQLHLQKTSVHSV